MAVHPRDLCRRCAFWAGRKPGHYVNLPCRSIRTSAASLQAQDAVAALDDTFTELPSDADFGSIPPRRPLSARTHKAPAFVHGNKSPQYVERRRDAGGVKVSSGRDLMSQNRGRDRSPPKDIVKELLEMAASWGEPSPAQESMDESPKAVARAPRKTSSTERADERPAKKKEGSKSLGNARADPANPHSDPTPARLYFVEARSSIVEAGGDPEIVPIRNAVLHIFNYAARFLDLPQIIHRRGQGQLRHTTVRLPKAGLQSSAAALQRRDALNLACTTLQMKIEKQHATLGNSPLDLADGSALNIDNAMQFLSFFRITHPGVDINFSTRRHQPDDGREIWSAVVVMNNKMSSRLVSMDTYRDAVAVAALTAAVTIVSSAPELFPQFQDWLKETGGLAPPVLIPLDAGVDRNADDILRRCMESVQRMRLLDNMQRVQLPEPSPRTGSLTSLIRARAARQMREQSSLTRSSELKLWQEERAQDLDYQAVQAKLNEYPITQAKADILTLVRNNPHSIIIGPPGSGKSTMVPQILLDDAIADGRGVDCNIICTVPRRTAALALAHRVAETRREPLGFSVGYSIGGHQVKCQSGGSITYCTPEILTMQLESDSELLFDSVSHIIVDEAHLRDTQSDKLLAAIKLSLARRMGQGKPAPRIILMSGSLFSNMYETYFELTNESGQSILPPSIRVPGLQHPVRSLYLDDVLEQLEQTFSGATVQALKADMQTQKFLQGENALTTAKRGQTQGSDGLRQQQCGLINWRSQHEISGESSTWAMSEHLIAATIAHVLSTTPSGSLLVFLPGWSEISRVERLLRSPGSTTAIPEDVPVFLLHSSNPLAMNQATEPPLRGVRRVLLSTDIAETSLTFTDVKYVIDGGKRRIVGVDNESDIRPVGRDWISKSSVVQRKGRIGRVESGTYYALYSENRLRKLRDSVPSAILYPGELQQLCLRSRARFPELTIKEYFGTWLEPPPLAQIQKAISDLQNIDALTEDEELTNYGQMLGQFSTSPLNVRTLVLAAAFRCLEPILALSIMPQQASIFAPWQNARMVSDVYADGTQSDHIASANAFMDLCRVYELQGETAAREYAGQQQLHFRQFENMYRGLKLVRAQLRRFSFVPDYQSANARSHHDHLVKALILAAHPFNIAVHNSSFRFHTPSGIQAYLDHKSALAPEVGWAWKRNSLKGTIACYSEIYSNFGGGAERAVLHDATPVTPLSAVFFGRTVQLQPGTEDTLLVNGWIPLRFESRPSGIGGDEVEDIKAEDKSIEGEIDDVVTPTKIAQTLLEFRKLWDAVSDAACRGYGTRWDRKGFPLGDPRPLRMMVETIADVLAQEARMLYKRPVPTDEKGQMGAEQIDAADLWKLDYGNWEAYRNMEHMVLRGFR